MYLTILLFLSTRHPPTSTLFPYTTLFRSDGHLDPMPHVRSGHCPVDPPMPAMRRTRRHEGDAVSPLSRGDRSEEHTSELQSHSDLVCRLLLEKKKRTEKICDHLSRSQTPH